MVQTDVPAQVRVDAQSPSGTTVSATSDGTSHRLALEGLTPGTTYGYVVRINGEDAGPPQRFRTPGVTGTAEGSQAVVGIIGDMGSGGQNERANAQLLAGRGDLELLLTVGDNAYPKGAPSEWTPQFFEPLAAVLPRVTLAPTPGDHEYLTPGATGYLDAFDLPTEASGTERYYGFDYGNLHVSAVDTNCLEPVDAVTRGCEAEDMKAWLAKDLASTKAPWKVVVMHRPAVSSGRYGSSELIARELIPLFELGKVDVVFQGHNHSYERSWPLLRGEVLKESYEAPGGPVYVTTGGGGDWIYSTTLPQPAWSAFRATAYQHVVMVMNGGSLSIEAIQSDGTTLDQFTLRKDVPGPTGEKLPASPSSAQLPMETSTPVQDVPSVESGPPEAPHDVSCTTADAWPVAWWAAGLLWWAQRRAGRRRGRSRPR
jgi:acid phosphatase type 7